MIAEAVKERASLLAAVETERKHLHQIATLTAKHEKEIATKQATLLEKAYANITDGDLATIKKMVETISNKPPEKIVAATGPEQLAQKLKEHSEGQALAAMKSENTRLAKELEKIAQKEESAKILQMLTETVKSRHRSRDRDRSRSRSRDRDRDRGRDRDRDRDRSRSRSTSRSKRARKRARSRSESASKRPKHSPAVEPAAVVASPPKNLREWTADHVNMWLQLDTVA